MVETRGVIDRPLLLEVRRHLTGRTWPLRLLMAVCAAAGALQAWWGRYGTAFVFLSLLALFFLQWSSLAPNAVRLILARFQENYGTDAVVCVTRLEDTGVTVEHGPARGGGTIPYRHFVRLAETEHAYILFTEAEQSVFLFKSSLTPERQAALLSFLKEKPTRIRW